ncbi:serine hydrolase domain-containing protein [Pseudoalteromonas spongiae]|uniref:serine hydrolase domain-containing protein n=1 Tax=Pseudoalteromonas spongiae TaxID=298657 RepID=UPI00373649C5
MLTAKIASATIGLVLSFSLYAKEQPTTQTTKSAIENVVNSYVSHGAFEGVLLVSQSGEKIFEQAYGFANYDNRTPISVNSSFQIASLSKPITATLVLKLKEQGKLKLESTLADYFTEFDNDIGRQITLHHLLNHTSGIPNHFTLNNWFNRDFHKVTTEQAFVDVIANMPPSAEPGEEHNYSNPAYFLLGKIIEKVTGQSFAQSLKTNILAPLNMTRSGVVPGNTQSAHVIKAHQWQDAGGYKREQDNNYKLFGAGAAIYSSADDLYRFDLALYGTELVNAQSKRQLFNPDLPYSWRVGKLPITESRKVNAHMYDGKIKGYSSMVLRLIDDKHSVILLSNNGMSYQLKRQLVGDIAKVLYGEQAPNRENDVALALTQAITTGTFEKVLTDIKANKYTLDEGMMTSFAYELLWSNLASKSLQLFAVIGNQFKQSEDAKHHFAKACNHRLVKNLEERNSICSATF